ncbi:TetR/AcrR family transcriptional regulator [Lentzea tibetensis]|uniref:TetR/AcrR family transcriptional regulator n=1 Tax=Lentzea tibetensis TaxID=2591470 RepID=A0A563EWZ8_9PSEU|nr:TetR/AcrR family transcriptional regulator [Lentzea tibetensis]
MCRVDQPATTPSAPKGEQTRALILETALRLFQENGYDRTTMRAIAKDAGVSVGNAYYYFESKEHLVQGFYDRMVALHREAVAPLLASEPKFAARLDGVMQAWLEVSEPYHEFAAQFFKNAADPASPLSPFSDESSPARDAGIGLMRSVLLGSTAKVDPELREDLPELLWLYQMAVVLFWVHDKSEKAAKTGMLVRRSTPLIARLLQLSATRVFRPLTREGVQLFRDIGWFTSK